MPSTADKRRTFRKLHESGCFVIPNPWDVGSARYLQGLGFQALATTSSGFAFSQGYADGAVPFDTVLAHFRTLAAASDVPINADFEHGFAPDPDGVARNVRRCIETGIAGLSIEDASGDPAQPLFALEEAVTRLRAARRAIDDSGEDVLLVGRAEGLLIGHGDLDDVVRRLQAYADAGADVLYAPKLRTRDEIERVVEAVAPKPINFLNSVDFGFSVADLAAMGVRRISVGGTLARVAWTALTRAAREIAEHGTFANFAGSMSNAELNAFFDQDRSKDAP
ncbi:MAG TPA: isocitrate lyase/phosphoenolpyruvate mutase family protein [Pseudolabrys sp.]|nr:isocitrate lyase/phosphoenolpyruvate mutase family protein [Pseudolabrys sp.]